MPEFEIDPDVRRATTLPSRFYLDAEIFERSGERIFSRGWHFVGCVDEVRTLRPITILPGILDEPVLLSRHDGSVRCISNVCTHRGKLLVEEPCEANLIRCGYHGRRFSLDGKCLSMPEFDGVIGFPSNSDDLHVHHLSEKGRFLFAAIEPAAPFEVFAGEAISIFTEFDGLPLTAASETDYEVAAHWALYCENYLEGFHIPYVHKSLNEIVDYGTYTTETFRYSSLQTGYDADGKLAARYLFIFPNLMFNFYRWGVSVNIVEPIAPDRTRVRFLKYIADESELDRGAGSDLDRVELEDEAVVESVQKGIRSRFYDRGRYSPTREQGTHHFHRLIAEFIG